MRRLLAAFAVIAAVSVAAGNAWAQSFTPAQRLEIVQILREALKSDPSLLRDAVAAMESDQAQQSEAAARAAIGALGPALTQREGDPVAGNPRGKVTVVEFYDVRCPYCRRMLPTIASLLAQDPDVRVVYKDMPVLGAASVLGAKALLAAQRQGGYQKLHDALMAGATDITEASLKSFSQRLGLDWTKLRADMDSPDVQSRIAFNLGLAQRLDLQGTPAYVIGAKLLPGAVDLADLQAAVAAARKQGG
jgi:protein-disulfide isomerase